MFLAHRKEILTQSIAMVRQVIKDQNLGDLWVGDQSPSEHNHIFASIQTLNAKDKYKQFDSAYFDYILIDEAHHAASKTYFDDIVEVFKNEL